jgi:hypothetical protein
MTGEDDVLIPPTLDEETGLEVCEELATMDEPGPVNDAWED